jgi:hypothetical protein
MSDGDIDYFLEFDIACGGYLADLVGTILRQERKVIRSTILFNFIMSVQF